MRFLCVIFVLGLFVGNSLAAVVLRDETGVDDLRFGFSISALEDQNNNGIWELLVGAPGYQAGGQDAGRVYLWFGGTQLSLNADRIWTGQPAERFGHVVARIGDVNGDGKPDFAVGAPFANNAGQNAGRVYIFYGGNPISAVPDLILEGRRAGEHFGWSIAALGDFNGDGRDDFAVGAPYSNAGAMENGAVYIFYGRNGHPNTTHNLELTGPEAHDHFGWSVGGVDRFLGGNARCLAVGAPSTGSGAGARQGTAYVFRGTTSSSPGPNTTPDLVLRSNAGVTAGNAFGYSVAGIGDFGGNNAPDLAVGIPNYSGGSINRGRVELFFGGASANATTDRYANGASAGDRFGWSIAGVGDIIGSAAADVVIGAPYDNTHGVDAGRAFVWAGGSGNVESASSLPQVERVGLREGTAAGDHFGAWVAWAGDIDGDGLDDFVVAAPSGNISNNATAGWVRLVDSSGVAVPVRLGAWRSSWTDDGGVLAVMDLHGSVPQVNRVVFQRRDTVTGIRTVLHDGPPATGSAVVLEELRLILLDEHAAHQLHGRPVYALTLYLDGGDTLERDALPGPAGPVPQNRAQLLPAQPNPFNPQTTLQFRAPMGDQVELQVFDLRGRQLCVLYRDAASGVWQQVTWDGRDAKGSEQPAGVYLARLRTGRAERIVRVALVR